MTPEYEQEIAANLERAEQSKTWLSKATTILQRRVRIMQPFTEPQRFCSMRVWISASIAGLLLRFISDLSRRGN